MLDHLPAYWPPPIKKTSAPPRRHAISTAIVTLPPGGWRNAVPILRRGSSRRMGFALMTTRGVAES
jgi:hypothetical protein